MSGLSWPVTAQQNDFTDLGPHPNMTERLSTEVCPGLEKKTRDKIRTAMLRKLRPLTL
jgi:uncharacterized protein YihD (DUF1040 family)